MPQGPAFLSDGGETGALIRAHDWSATPLGTPGTWPGPLRTLVDVMLSADQPMFIAWGPGRTLLYNDAYAEILATKHPAAMGRDLLEVWSEIRADLVPIVGQAYAGLPVHMDDITLVMERRGYREETHFAFSYTPIRNETGATVGFFCPCIETTGEVLAARRQAFRLTLEERLRALADPGAVMAAAVALLGEHLSADRVGYSEIVDDRIVRTAGSYAVNGLAPLNGDFPIEAFGEAMVARQRRGMTEVSDDVLAGPERAGDIWAAIGTRSVVSVPLVRGGRFVASLYVNNREPRRWSREDVALIEEVAARTWDAVERARTGAALRESEGRLQLALGASGVVGLFDWRVPEDRFFADARFAQLFGVDPDRAAAGVPIAEFVQAIHPEDRPSVEATVARTAETGVPYEAEYRVLQAGGEARWVAARGACLRESGEPVRFVGTAVDIHARKLAEERQELLSREVDHRAKNALAVVLAALQLTQAPDLPSYVRAITGRVKALARAQTLLADDRWAGADLGTLLRGELEGFLTDGVAGEPRASLTGPRVSLPTGAAQPLAMAVHELATNATKHGVLSAPEGHLAITWSLEGRPPGTLRLRWAETGGPSVAGPPARRGFGSRVLDGTVRGQLGGEVSLAWPATGLVCDIAVPLARMASVSPGDFVAEKTASNSADINKT